LAGSETFRLDSVEIQLGGKPVAHHLYTFKELEALQKGGVQRIYTGNISIGEHDLKVSVIGKSSGGTDFQKMSSFKFNKDVGPKIVEVCLADLFLPNQVAGKPPYVVFGSECWYEGSCVTACTVEAIRLEPPLINRVRWKPRFQ